MDGILGLADGITQELRRLLPRQRKTQRTGLALLVATMLDVRNANLMDLAAGLPQSVARIDMRYQWISRVLMNSLIDPDEVMAPFAREVFSRLAAEDRPLVLIIDQSKLNDRHQVLMLAVCFGDRALPVLWRVEETEGAIGFSVQKAHLFALENVQLTARKATTNIGVICDPDHAEPWIIAMAAKPGYLKTLDYSARWAIELMFSDFKSRGFGIEDTQIQHSDRLGRLLLVMALALYTAVSIGQWDAKTNPIPAEKRREAPAEETRPLKDILFYQRLALYRPPHPRRATPAASLVSKN